MTTVHLLHAGYNHERVGSSITLVRDGDALIVTDPGLVAHRSRILDPLRDLGVAPEDVTHIFISHHHPDHMTNIALFPNAWLIDVDSRYKDDQWLTMRGTATSWHPARGCG
jgi:glyoxylase-like metal-dependent hydrolase (beta-lactamase superfamily II)